MTKLTTEFLSKLQDNLLQFQDHYSDPADKENYDIFVDALHVLDEFKAAKEKLLAYEQAAKNPIGYTDEAELRDLSRVGTAYIVNGEDVNIDVNDGCWFPVYRAPVVPCPYPCGWDNLNKLVIQDAALVACGLVEGEVVTEGHRQAAVGNNEILLKVIASCRSGTLKAQPVSEPKAEGDFLSRLKAEHVELEDRCIKLANFIQVNPEFKKLAPRMQRLLESQAAAMVEYDSILERRIYLIEDASAPAQESE